MCDGDDEGSRGYVHAASDLAWRRDDGAGRYAWGMGDFAESARRRDDDDDRIEDQLHRPGDGRHDGAGGVRRAPSGAAHDGLADAGDVGERQAARSGHANADGAAERKPKVISNISSGTEDNDEALLLSPKRLQREAAALDVGEGDRTRNPTGQLDAGHGMDQARGAVAAQS